MQFHTCFALIRRYCIVLLAVGFVLGAGLATPAGAETQTVVQVAQAPGDTANDPLESVNRVIFELNEILQTILFRPLAELYKFILPDAVEEGVHNILLNLRTPVILANDLLQFEGKRALVTVQRFAIKTTLSCVRVLEAETRRRTVEKGGSLHFVGHQANLLMLQSVASRLGLADEEHWYNVIDYGNTGAAGAPCVLSQHWDELADGDSVIMVVVGSGLTWSSFCIDVG